MMSGIVVSVSSILGFGLSRSRGEFMPWAIPTSIVIMYRCHFRDCVLEGIKNMSDSIFMIVPIFIDSIPHEPILLATAALC